MDVEISPLRETDRKEWEPIFDAYRTFHQISADPAVNERVWSWLMDPKHASHGLAARLEGRVVGIVHYRISPRSIAGDSIVNLDDLYSVPECRGQGIGRKLVESVVAIARREGAHEVQWVTNGWNTNAQGAYRRFSEETDWITYTIRTPSN